MSGFVSVGYFLFNLCFSLIIFMLWARIALRYFRISSLHPISHAIHSISNPLVLPFAMLIPVNKKQSSRYDWVSFAALVTTEVLKFILLSLLFLHGLMPVLYLFLFVIADLVAQPCNLLFYAILVRVIMSWVNPAWNHPISDILRIVTEPALRLGRRIIPDISGFDFSPFLIMVVLKIITLFISGSLPLPLI